MQAENFSTIDSSYNSIVTTKLFEIANQLDSLSETLHNNNTIMITALWRSRYAQMIKHISWMVYEYNLNFKVPTIRSEVYKYLCRSHEQSNREVIKSMSILFLEKDEVLLLKYRNFVTEFQRLIVSRRFEMLDDIKQIEFFADLMEDIDPFLNTILEFFRNGNIETNIWQENLFE